MKILIATPVARDMKPGYVRSIFALCFHLNKKCIEFDYDMITGSSLLPAARTMIFERAIEGGYTHVLCIDDDMQFDPEAVDFLIDCCESVVVANCVGKNGQRQPNTFDMERKQIFSKDKTGAERITQSGMAFVLINTAILPHLQKPWFEVPFIPGACHMGEDVYFFRLLEHCGIPVYVSHDASKLVWHIGDFAWQE